MKCSLQDLVNAAPDLDPKLAAEHLARLSDDYCEIFSPSQIAAHIRGLATLSPQHPVHLIVQTANGLVEVTVLAYDYQGVFSLITGVLSASGFSIQSGQIFTYQQAEEDTGYSGQRRRIVDVFAGSVDTHLALEEWTALVDARLRDVVLLLEAGTEEARQQARRRVNEWVADRLAVLSTAKKKTVLYPVQLEVTQQDNCATRLRVCSQDTPFFLYTLSNALALYGAYIERVKIRTIAGKVDDEIIVKDITGRAICDPSEIERLKLSVLLTKQFSYFLDRSPDPSAALERFEQVLGEILGSPRSEKFIQIASDPHAMKDLARLLGTSDFLWEDFIRLQYESLVPILQSHAAGKPLAIPAEELAAALQRELAACESYEEACRRLNEFKDRQIFLIDLENILYHQGDFDKLAEHLTALAEAVVQAAVSVIYSDLVKRYGEPRSVAGLPSRMAVFGLGKFGGAALGYGSDIELLTIYSDSGTTAGPERITNAEFFSLLVQRLSRFIKAKREGIFRIDLRLRPYGESGPLACSLDSFCRYYGPGGPAHSYEKLALVRLRAVAGDPDLGRRVERIRDELVYLNPDINLEELRNLRTLQFDEKNRPGKLNAKFSPGALVDLEYTVQILQVTYGGKHPELRTPRLREALAALSRTGVLPEEQCAELLEAYRFLRRLINALRMLRGSAEDLFLPELDSDEYTHLARRMGYQPRRDLSAPQQLHLDFETHSAAVREFARNILGRDALPSVGFLSVADLVFSESLPPSTVESILSRAGFEDPHRAAYNLRQLAKKAPGPAAFAPLAVMAFDVLKHEPDPDMALNNWELFVARLPYPAEHYETLLAQPRRLEILLGIFSRSQFFASTLAANPEFFEWVTEPRILHQPRQRAERLAELRALSLGNPDPSEWRRGLCLFRRRELLRIGTRDIFLQVPVRDVSRDLSELADSILLACLERLAHDAAAPLPVAVIALGKLGGCELNYSSDIDLVLLHPDDLDEHQLDQLRGRLRLLLADLTATTECGHIYRVDLRLRPYGGAGELTLSPRALQDYFRRFAQPWERQALLKARVIYAPAELGRSVNEALRAALQQAELAPADIVQQVLKMRSESVAAASGKDELNVKLSPGGIRDIEFLAQAFQLAYLRSSPELAVPGTLEALEALAQKGLIPAQTAAQLSEHYSFLRRVEHFLQIMDDRQVHALPLQQSFLKRLARRMYGPEGTAAGLSEELLSRMRQVRRIFEEQINELSKKTIPT